MFVVAANFATYWDLPIVWQTLIFYVFGPFLILCINGLGIKVCVRVRGMQNTNSRTVVRMGRGQRGHP